MEKNESKKRTRSKSTKIIALNTLFVIFTLASAFTGTYAWFMSNNSYEATAGSFSIESLPGTEFDLYYLDYFANNNGSLLHDGNWDRTNHQFSGYETDYDNPVFTKVTYDAETGCDVTNTCTFGVNDERSCNPTNIAHIWPAHKLTFAIVLTQGAFDSFNVDQWTETISASAMTNENTYVHLSWAIDIYGAAVKVGSEGDDLVDDVLPAGFASYRSGTHRLDGFAFSENRPAPMREDQSTWSATYTGSSVKLFEGLNGTGNWTVIYFTIEFSNSNSTFYSQSVTSPYYYSQNSTVGNSNCYIGLSFTSLEFAVK